MSYGFAPLNPKLLVAMVMSPMQSLRSMSRILQLSWVRMKVA